MTDSKEAVMRREVGAQGPQGCFFQPCQAVLDLENGRASIRHEQSAAENAESYFRISNSKDSAIQRNGITFPGYWL